MPRNYTPGRQPGAKHPSQRWRVQPLRSLRKAGRDTNIDKTTLKRIFTDEMEEELAKHLKQLADQFHGLAPVKCRELALEYAEKNNIPVPLQGPVEDHGTEPGGL
ncbi:unnamed protein product [Pleuronectes platessa]|uniref:Uncharacterized protein n=1 Tax=Pleuronectes platessa TaxID=8262 RepID=A0A9N7TVA1_PLEPL|nr:unnamed protein product [Pleuronectes platessa]